MGTVNTNRSDTPKPSASRYPQPKARGNIGSGQANLRSESYDQLRKAASATGYRHNNSRPKGV